MSRRSAPCWFHNVRTYDDEEVIVTSVGNPWLRHSSHPQEKEGGPKKKEKKKKTPPFTPSPVLAPLPAHAGPPPRRSPPMLAPAAGPLPARAGPLLVKSKLGKLGKRR
jgi:hypothetical protein